jgi:hypothetical protein
MEKIVQTDIDNLADIIWWIKGYKAGADEDANSCPFGLDHIESLRKIRVLLHGLDKKTREEEEATHSPSPNKQRDLIKPCTCNPKPNAWSAAYRKCVVCGGLDKFEERV